VTERLLVVDGNSLLHRAFHAYERSGMSSPTPISGELPAYTDGGARTRPAPGEGPHARFAVHGFLALLTGILDKVSPDALIVAFDDTDNERKRLYPGYKATRSPKAPELVSQLLDVQLVLGALGVQVVVERAWEADDVVASAAAAATAAGWQTVIATSDRDAFALIDEQVTVLRLVSGLDNAVWLTPEALFERYQIRPDQYLDYAALRGDPSDELPGVAGFGEKTAAKLLAGCGSVSAALADPSAATAAIGRVPAAKLVAGRAAWEHNVAVMTPRLDVAVDLEAARLAHLDEGHVLATLRAADLPKVSGRLTTKLTAAAGGRGERRSRGEVVSRPDDHEVPLPEEAPGYDEAPMPDAEPQGAPGARRAQRRARQPFDPASVRGPGRGLPEAEDSTPVVLLPGGRRLATTGGALRPERLPVTF
jgi:5'-3' exonuclease